MAAFVGILAPDGQLPSALELKEACCHLSERSSGPKKVLSEPNLFAAYRGPDEGYFDDGRFLVLLDGNLEFSDDRNGLCPQGEPFSGAKFIAESLANNGTAAARDLHGLFAALVFDRKEERVHLVCDSFGSKRLLYGRIGQLWYFGSETKFLVRFVRRSDLNHDAISEACHYHWLAGRNTFLSEVSQVLPGYVVSLAPGRDATQHRYFAFNWDSATDGTLESWADRTDSAIDEYFHSISKRVRRVAVLLSGGVDSSFLAAKALQHSFTDVVAVTGQWAMADNPELDRAIQISKHLGIRLLKVDFDETRISADFPRIIWQLEEIPRHYHVFALEQLLHAVSSQVDAVLYGGGADAMFGPGEQAMLLPFLRKQQIVGRIPRRIREKFGRMLPREGESLLARFGKLLRDTPQSYMLRLDSVSDKANPAKLIDGIAERPWPADDVVANFAPNDGDYVRRFQELHLYTMGRSYLLEMDRLTCRHRIELLAPFFSSWILPIALQLPSELKYVNRSAKPVLKTLAARYLPEGFVNLPKFGFPTPAASLINGPLKPWVALLASERSENRNLFRRGAFNSMNGKSEYEVLWAAACLEMYLRLFVDGDPLEKYVQPSVN